MGMRLAFLLALSAVFFVVVQDVQAATADRRPAAQPVRPPTTPAPKDAKKKRMEHPAFANAGVQKGMEIWRIENFEPVPVPRETYGKFFTGDSYIVLNTKEDSKKKLSWDLHFWLGSKTSTDESGAAAYLTVALDDKLGGAPVQHREVQGYESPLFIGYFKPAIRYLEGGHASGFNQVTTNAGAEKRMFQVKGNKNIRVKQCEPAISSMNTGDCFILDVDHSIFVYVGPKARRIEKIKAISVANQIRDQDHNGRAKIEIIDEFSPEHDFEHFFTALGHGDKNSVPEESAGGDDQQFEVSEADSVALYRITDESGKLQAIPVAQKPLRQEHLNENDCYVLDAKTGGIFVWVGRSCSKAERAEVMNKAQEYLQSKSYPNWVRVTRVPQGGESAAFKQYFATWKDAGALHSRIIRSVSDEEMYSSDSEVAEAKKRKVAKSGSARGFMPDLGGGHVTIYRIQGNDLVEVADSSDPERSSDDGSKYGQFFQGDAYVIKYEYTNSNDEPSLVVAYWLGKDASADELDGAYAEARKINDEAEGDSVLIKVPQGHEPKHFLKLFNGKMVTHLGGYGSEFKNSNSKDSYDSDGVRLYKVEGSEGDSDMRAEQVAETSHTLAEESVFLLETPDSIYAWIGNEASDEEKETVEYFTKAIFGDDKEAVIVNQGEEPEEFWDALGGAPEEMRKSSIIHQRTRLRVGREPHLLQVIVNRRGRVTLQDIGGYTQEDLDDDDIFILDSGEEVYVWIGSQSTSTEKAAVEKAFTRHLKDDPSDRTVDTCVVITVKRGREPAIFKKMFDEWDDDMWANQTSYDDIKSRMLEQNEVM